MTSASGLPGFLMVGVIASLIFYLFPSIDITIQLAVLGISVAVLGLPHGAIDAYIAERSRLWQSFMGLAAFAVAYTMVAVLVIGVWIVLPVVSLAAFLIASAWHFGADNGASKPIERWLFGGALLSLPAFFDRSAVAEMFEALSGPSAGSIASALQFIAPILTLGLICAISVRPQKQPVNLRGLGAVIVLIVFAWLLPPLGYFVVYFCALHSPLHFGRVLKLVPKSERLRAVALTAGFSAITILLALLTFLTLRDFVPFDKAALQIIFIGLASLTVPHMFLVDGICRSQLGDRR